MSSRYEFRSFMNIRSCISPSFSHDGKYIIFLTNITGTPQVWRVPTKGGWPEQLTYYDDRVTKVLCSPISSDVAFSRDSGGNERDQIYLLSPEKGLIEPWAIENDVIHGLGTWSFDGKNLSFCSNSRNRAFFDVYAVQAGSGRPERVMEHDGTNYPEAWSHNGKLLIVQRRNTNLDSDYHLVDTQTKESTCLTAHTGEATFSNACFTPDDQSIICLTNRDREFEAIVSIDIKTCSEKLIWEAPWDIESLALSPDGKLALYSVNEDGYSRLVLRDLTNEKTLEATGLPKGVVAQTTWSPDGKSVAFTFSSSVTTSDVWILDAATAKARKLTHSDMGGIPQKALVEPDIVHFKTFDGLNVPAFLYMPVVWEGKKPPVVMNVHGGPEGQTRPNFSAVTQYLVNHGYAVLAPNVRGSTGYGKTYVHLDDTYKRMDSVHDLKYAHGWLAQSKKVDGQRIAVYGGSYGGFMVLAALTTYPELWAAGIDLYGIANFTTFLQTTGPWRRSLRAAEYGHPEKDKDLLVQISPVHKADRITAPLMVVQGANDPRVPKSETDQIVEALEKRGIAVRYVQFDDEGHGIVKLKNRLVAYGAVVEFLDEHLTVKQ